MFPVALKLVFQNIETPDVFWNKLIIQTRF